MVNVSTESIRKRVGPAADKTGVPNPVTDDDINTWLSDAAALLGEAKNKTIDKDNCSASEAAYLRSFAARCLLINILNGGISVSNANFTVNKDSAVIVLNAFEWELLFVSQKQPIKIGRARR